MVALGTTIKKIITLMLTVATLVMPGYFGDITKGNEPVDPDKCLLNVVALSDTHVRADGMYGYNDMLFKLVLEDLEAASVKADALVIAGDVTDGGEEDEWQYAQNLFAQYDPAKKIYLAVGNHDTWTEESKGTYAQLFKEYSQKITGKKIAAPYHATKINGYYFIFLASESDSTGAYFSQKQLKWLENHLENASKAGKPIFVVSHWPRNKTHGLPVSWGEEDYDDMTGGMGEQSAQVKKLLNKYKNVILISGHIHSGFSKDKDKNGYKSVEKYGNITSVNLPAVSDPGINGHYMIGTGYNIEVYKDKILFRARNYATGHWHPEYDFTLKLK